MAKTVLFFDVDNTLYDHEKAFENAMKDCFITLFRHRRHDVNRWFPLFKKNCDLYWEAYEKGSLTRSEYQHVRLEKSLIPLHLTATESLSRRFQQQYEQTLPQFISPFAGVHDFFERTHTDGQKIGIITNGSGVTQRRKLESLKVNRWIASELVIISGEVGTHKPDHRIFRIAAENIETTNASYIYIGDSWKLDIVPSIEVGWDAVYLNTRGERPATSHKPLAQCRSFPEVSAFLHEYLKLA